MTTLTESFHHSIAKRAIGRHARRIDPFKVIVHEVGRVVVGGAVVVVGGSVVVGGVSRTEVDCSVVEIGRRTGPIVEPSLKRGSRLTESGRSFCRPGKRARRANPSNENDVEFGTFSSNEYVTREFPSQ